MVTREPPPDSVDVHDLEPEAFYEEVHSFEFWFQAIEGYLSGTTWGHRPDTQAPVLTATERERLITVLCNYCVGETAALEASSGLVAIAPNRFAKIFLSTQVVTTRPFFKEFVVRCPKPPAEINRRLLGHKIIGGYELGQAYPHLADCLLFCITELNTRAEMDRLVAALEEVGNG